MQAKQLFSAVSALGRSKLFGTRIPLAVSWALTFRCNQRCVYCGIWKNECRELNTQEISDALKQLNNLGTKWISFTGGEPLLREDIGEILRGAKENGFYASVSSNGRLVPEKIKQLRFADRIKLSLDGPSQIHNLARGKGSFEAVEEAIKACKQNNIHVCLECVISKINLNYMDWAVNFAKEHQLRILFQPSTRELLWTEAANPVAAEIEEYKNAISFLKEKKKEGFPVLNSLAGLGHLYDWPIPKKINCSAGFLSFDIEPDGSMLACDRAVRKLSKTTHDGQDFATKLKKTSPINGCRQCWCSSIVEFNLITAFNRCAAMNFLRNNK